MYLGNIEQNTSDVAYFKTSTDGDDSTYLMEDPDAAANARTRTARIVEIYDYDSAFDGTFANDKSAQNKEFESEAADFIDFSESNPFGEVDDEFINTSASVTTADITFSSTSRTIDSDYVTFDRG